VGVSACRRLLSATPSRLLDSFRDGEKLQVDALVKRSALPADVAQELRAARQGLEAALNAAKAAYSRVLKLESAVCAPNAFGVFDSAQQTLNLHIPIVVGTEGKPMQVWAAEMGWGHVPPVRPLPKQPGKHNPGNYTWGAVEIPELRSALVRPRNACSCFCVLLRKRASRLDPPNLSGDLPRRCGGGARGRARCRHRLVREHVRAPPPRSCARGGRHGGRRGGAAAGVRAA